MAALDDYSADDTDDGGETLADANRRKLNWLETQLDDLEDEYEDRISDLEAENTRLRRKVAELTDGEGDW